MKVHTGSLLIAAAWAAAVGVVAPKAEARCNRPEGVCFAIYSCMVDVEPRRAFDRQRIEEGIKTGNGNLIWQGTDACFTDRKLHKEWSDWSGGCQDSEYADIGRSIKQKGPEACRFLDPR